MQVYGIRSFENKKYKTNSVNNQNYVAKTNYNFACDTVTFGLNPGKAEQKVNEILPRTREVIDKVIELLKKEGGASFSLTKEIGKGEVTIAHITENGEFLLIDGHNVEKGSAFLEGKYISTKGDQFEIYTMGKDGKVEYLTYTGQDNEDKNNRLASLLERIFLTKQTATSTP